MRPWLFEFEVVLTPAAAEQIPRPGARQYIFAPAQACVYFRGAGGERLADGVAWLDAWKAGRFSRLGFSTSP